MSFNYVMTAQRATAVTAAVKCNFTGTNNLNLIVVRNTRMEIFTVTDDGLKIVKEVGVYGRIAILKPFRPSGESKDLLFLLTSKYNAAILEWRSDGEIITRAYGSVAENTGRPSETGMIAIIDPECKMIGLRLVDGLFKILQWQSDSRELKMTSLRMEQMSVLDIAFLHGANQPTIAFIHQSSNNGRHIQTYEVNMQEKELFKGPWKQENIESEAQFIIAVPAPVGGVVVIGEESITYHVSESRYVAVAPPVIRQSTMVVWERIEADGLRYLLGDMAGRLFMLVLETATDGPDGNGPLYVKDLKVELLGETSIAEALVYLDNGVVFVGSRLGDSQLIRLTTEPDERGGFVIVLESYTNLGPIIDMALVDLERQGQNQLVTCSNAFKEGSLRIIRNGVGIQEHASIDLAGIKGMWALELNTSGVQPTGVHNCLALSFDAISRTLMLEGEEVEETEIPGVEYDEQTFFAGVVADGLLLQVTASGARLVRPTIGGATGGLVDLWPLPPPPDGRSTHAGRRVTMAACNTLSGGQLLVVAGRDLYYLVVGPEGKFCLENEVTLDYEVSCVDMSLTNDTGVAEIAAVGLWTEISVRVLHLPTMNVITHELLGGDIIPRSVLICRFEGILYLLVALGDGVLLYYRMHHTTGALIDKKRMTIGTQPPALKAFKSRGSVSVFGCSDRPTIIYSSNQKLVFSNVNLRMATNVCSLNTSLYNECLALTDGETLSIGSVDEIQKLHIRTVPLGESPRRIAHQHATRTFAVLTHRYEIIDSGGQKLTTRQSASTLAQTTSHSGQARQASTSGAGAATSATTSNQLLNEGEEYEVHNLIILDQNTFEVIHSHQLGANEHGCSLISCRLGDDPSTYYVVGTAFVQPDESEAKRGRLLVFEFTNTEQAGPQLQLVHEKEIKGAPYALSEFNGKLLTAVNSSVRLFEWSSSPGEKELRLECSHFTFIVALYFKVKGDFVLVGDLMRSMTLLLYKPMEASFEEIARDFQPNWMTAVEIIDDDTFLGAENSFNLFTCQKDSAATTEEDRQHLQEIGRFHVGEMINVFRHGSLVMQQNAPAATNAANDPTSLTTAPIGDMPFVSTPVLFGTVLGAIGLVVQLTEPFFKFLQQLENRLAKTVRSVGKIEHGSWRAFHTERRVEAACGFVDGDLIDAFLDLPRDRMADVVRGLKLPAGFDDSSATAVTGGGGSQEAEREAAVDDVVKLVEELSRLN